MQIKKIFLSSLGAFCLVSASVQGLGFGVKLGPFELELGGGIASNRKVILEDPICYAIRTRKLLELIMEWEETNRNETIIITKKVTIEPYLFGRTKDGQPIIRGNVVADTVIKEITVKYPDDERDFHDEDSNEEKEEGFFSGLFRSSKKGQTKSDLDTLNVQKIVSVNVIEQSNFNPPKDFKGIFEDDVAEVICSVTLSPK